MSNTVTKAVQEIYKMDNDQLNQVIEAIKLRRTYLAREATRSFKSGQIVSFKSKTGGKITGSIQKVNRKYVIVDAHVGGTRYRVPASMLETV
jgi:hypothetical protein